MPFLEDRPGFPLTNAVTGKEFNSINTTQLYTIKLTQARMSFIGSVCIWWARDNLTPYALSFQGEGSSGERGL
jgi:hypothetical protein